MYIGPNCHSHYTREMPPSQQAERNRDDVRQNIARSVVNAVVIAPQNLISQMFNLNHHIDYISSFHQQRVNARIAAGEPATSGQKAALQAQQAQQAEQVRQEASLNAFGAALNAYGMVVQDSFRPDGTNAKLKLHAWSAMEKLFSQGLITKDDLKKFKNFQAANQEFRNIGSSGSDFLPLNAKKCHLCQATIGQAWIDAGLCDREDGVCLVDNAVPDFKITTGTCDMWWSV